MESSPQKNLQFISPPKEAGDFLQNQVKSVKNKNKDAPIRYAAVTSIRCTCCPANIGINEEDKKIPVYKQKIPI